MTEQRIKVLFLTNDLGLGGVQRLIVQFANAFDKEQFEVQVVTLFSREDSFVHKHELDSLITLTSFSFNGFFDVKNWLNLYRFLKEQHFDVVFTQLFFADTIGRITAHFAKVPVVVTEIQNLIPTRKKLHEFIDRQLRGITDLCLSPTHGITEYALSTIRFPKEKVLEIETNAVSVKKFEISIDKEKIKESIGIPKDAKLILSVGRLVEQKGHSVLLGAFPKILESIPNVYIAIAGSGKLEQQLKEQARELRLEDRVKLLGNRNDIPELLMSADVFVFPSLWEGQGLILFEAMFGKVPIIASNTGGIPEVIEHKKTGFLVEPGNPEKLAKGIVEVLESDELRKAMVEEALNRYGNRTIEEATYKLGTIFENLYKTKKNVT